MTSDIEAVQDFINSALLGMLVNVMTLVGMIGVMFYLNWRFTLIALSISPVLFVVVYHFTRRIKKASRAVRKKEGELLSIVEEVLTSIGWCRRSRAKTTSRSGSIPRASPTWKPGFRREASRPR